MATNTDLKKDALAEFELMIKELSRGKPIKNLDDIAIKFLVADLIDDGVQLSHGCDILQYLVHMNNYKI